MSNLIDKEVLEARAALWRKGILTWKLDSFQKQVVTQLRENQANQPVLLCSRRSGKTYFLTIMALELCLRNARSIVKFLMPEQQMVRSVLAPLMDEILADCPTDVLPKFSTKENAYIFPNKSKIQVAGTDAGNADRIRGGNSNLCIVDEAGFCDNLGYAINAVLLPTTLLTMGKIILSSTPPTKADHEFVKYVKRADANGVLIKKTIYDIIEDCKNDKIPRVTEQHLEHTIKGYPDGEESEEFRREYMVEIRNSSDNVFPEVDDLLMKDIVTEWVRPKFCHKYVSMDLGFKDLTAVIFAYYDFEQGVLVIEDELSMKGKDMTLPKLSGAIREKEETLWRNRITGEIESPYRRVADNNLIVLNDLNITHSLLFLPTQKDNKEGAVNHVRSELINRRIVINPRCKQTIFHIKNASWNKNRTGFGRSEDAGHYDFADALIYLVRNIDKMSTPFPRGYNAFPTRNTFKNTDDKKSGNYEDLAKLFQRKSSLKR